ncbi:MAG: hypothetical protein RL414_498 [Actinomycetota bacterium]|jgi:uncharacterized protein YoxC
MGPGGIAAIIAASALLIIAVAIAYAVVRVARLVDEVKKTVNSVNRITTTAEKFTDNVTNSIAGFLSKNGSVGKIFSVVASLVNRRGSQKDFD